MNEGLPWVWTWGALFVSITIGLILWVSTIPPAAAQPLDDSPIGRLHKPPGKPLSGFAEAHGLPR